MKIRTKFTGEHPSQSVMQSKVAIEITLFGMAAAYF